MCKISIIVPVYQVEALLDRCIKSLVAQTYSNLEIILVDDGSPDNCPAICDSWAAKDNRIHVIHKANGGLSDARNAGMAIARGDYIGFVDSDDWIAEDMYEKLYDKAICDNCDITACAVELQYEDGTPSCMLTHNSQEAVYTRTQAMEELLRERELLQPVWYKLYRTDIIRGLEFPTGKVHEDVFWSYRAIAAADRVGVICDVGYYYWQRSGSIMAAGYSRKRLDSIEAKHQRLAFLTDHMPEFTDLATLDLWFSCMYQGQCAIRNLTDKRECNFILRELKKALKQTNLSSAILSSQSLPHKFWLHLAQFSLPLACRIRNKLKIGT